MVRSQLPYGSQTVNNILSLPYKTLQNRYFMHESLITIGIIPICYWTLLVRVFRSSVPLQVYHL